MAEPTLDVMHERIDKLKHPFRNPNPYVDDPPEKLGRDLAEKHLKETVGKIMTEKRIEAIRARYPKDEMGMMWKDIRFLLKRVEALETVLGFYADEGNWPDPNDRFAHDVGNYAATNIDNDQGDVARDALKGGD